jgi:hypothetical protein
LTHFAARRRKPRNGKASNFSKNNTKKSRGFQLPTVTNLTAVGVAGCSVAAPCETFTLDTARLWSPSTCGSEWFVQSRTSCGGLSFAPVGGTCASTVRWPPFLLAKCLPSPPRPSAPPPPAPPPLLAPHVQVPLQCHQDLEIYPDVLSAQKLVRTIPSGRQRVLSVHQHPAGEWACGWCVVLGPLLPLLMIGEGADGWAPVSLPSWSPLPWQKTFAHARGGAPWPHLTHAWGREGGGGMCCAGGVVPCVQAQPLRHPPPWWLLARVREPVARKSLHPVLLTVVFALNNMHVEACPLSHGLLLQAQRSTCTVTKTDHILSPPHRGAAPAVGPTCVCMHAQLIIHVSQPQRLWCTGRSIYGQVNPAISFSLLVAPSNHIITFPPPPPPHPPPNCTVLRAAIAAHCEGLVRHCLSLSPLPGLHRFVTHQQVLHHPAPYLGPGHFSHQGSN